MPIGGIHFVYNSVCAFAVGDILNVEKEKIIKGISEFKLTAKRMDIEIIQDNIKMIKGKPLRDFAGMWRLRIL